MAQKYDSKRPASLDLFLEILQITEGEFIVILTKHTVDPWRFNPTMVEKGAPLPDMEKWDRTLLDEPKVGPRKDEGKKIGAYI